MKPIHGPEDIQKYRTSSKRSDDIGTDHFIADVIAVGGRVQQTTGNSLDGRRQVRHQGLDNVEASVSQQLRETLPENLVSRPND